MSDREIVDRILRRGEKRLFGAIVAKYSGAVVAKVLSITRDRELAAAAAQQTFVRAYSNLGAWRGDGDIAPWLAAIAAHVSINLMDTIRRRGEVPVAGDIADEDFSEAHEARLAALREAVAAQPPQEREIIRLHYHEGMKTDGIARRMGISQASVLTKLHRIRRKLKTYIEERGRTGK